MTHFRCGDGDDDDKIGGLAARCLIRQESSILHPSPFHLYLSLRAPILLGNCHDMLNGQRQLGICKGRKQHHRGEICDLNKEILRGVEVLRFVCITTGQRIFTT